MDQDCARQPCGDRGVHRARQPRTRKIIRVGNPCTNQQPRGLSRTWPGRKGTGHARTGRPSSLRYCLSSPGNHHRNTARPTRSPALASTFVKKKSRHRWRLKLTLWTTCLLMRWLACSCGGGRRSLPGPGRPASWRRFPVPVPQSPPTRRIPRAGRSGCRCLAPSW